MSGKKERWKVADFKKENSKYFRKDINECQTATNFRDFWKLSTHGAKEQKIIYPGIF